MDSNKSSTTIRIPTPLRTYTENRSSVVVEASTVGEALASLVDRYPALKPHLFNEQEQLRSFVNVFRNDDDIRYLDRENTPVSDKDEVSIVPSIAGGR